MASPTILLGTQGEPGLEIHEAPSVCDAADGLDGYVLGWRAETAHVARRLRHDGYAGPLVAALHCPSPEEVVAALSCGCDDAQPFPSARGELAARFMAIRRRLAQVEARPQMIRAGRLEIGRDGSDPKIDGRPLKVSPNCAKVLAFVASSRHPVPLHRIAFMLYGPEPPPSKTVNTYLCLLRSVMAAATGVGGWLTLKDGGYVLFDGQG